MSSKAGKPGPKTIALNKRAKRDYHIEQTFEAGLVLEGWEVKSLRAGKAQLVDSYVLVRDGEAWLLGANISPLPSASTHVVAEPQRTRKLLLHAKEIAQIASTIGRDFDFSLLSAVAGMTDGEVRSGLEKLADAEIVFGLGEPLAEEDDTAASRGA